MSAPVESDIPGKLFDGSLMRRMLKYIRPYLLPMSLGLLMVIPLTMLANTMPLLLRNATDRFLVASGLAVDARIAGLTTIALQYVTVGFGAFLLRFGQGYLLSWLGQKILFDMRADIFSKILRLPLAWFDRNPVGRLLTRVSTDVDAMQRLLTDGIVGLSTDLVMLVGVMGYMFYADWRLGSIMLGLFVPMLAVLLFLNRKVRAAHRSVRQRQAAMGAYLQETLGGMITVQVFNRQEATKTRYETLNAALRAAFLTSVRWFSYAFPATEFMNAVSLFLILGVGGHLILRGDEHLTIGTLIAFLAYLREFFRPLDDLSEKSNILQSAMASAERVFGLMDVEETVADPVQPAPLDRFRGEVAFEHVWFAYNDENWVLRDFDLRIPAGESLALVGATGAGKSSVISLLARFYDVQRGTVKVDGVNVRDYAQSELRRRIGIVLQDPFIFTGTIADNISLRNPAVTRERVIEAAKFVNAHNWIEQRPGGYDAPMQERGAGLSTGQKQLLAFARALAQDPDILLILDEATASVDTETELLIQDALRKIMKGRTCIVIAHRLSTIRDVHRIVVMRRGEMVEQGSHAELLRLDGYYRRLYELLSHVPPK